MPPREPQLPYERVTADFRRKIKGGELAPGEQLPSLDQIAAEYGVSRATAQRAVRELAEEGLVISRARWGTFVAERPGRAGRP